MSHKFFKIYKAPGYYVCPKEESERKKTKQLETLAAKDKDCGYKKVVYPILNLDMAVEGKDTTVNTPMWTDAPQEDSMIFPSRHKDTALPPLKEPCIKL